MQAADGDLYGTTYAGGAHGAGTVYRIRPSDGTLTTLYSFCAQGGCTDGQMPTAGLLEDSNGNLYGTTLGGGAHGDYGTIFRITRGGALTTLYSFCAESGCGDGASPYAALVRGSDRNFYGTTFGGGASNVGTVYKITSDSTLTTLYSFCFPCADGANPLAALLAATDGNFYGTTANGGTGSRGTLFKMLPTGSLIPLYSFCAQPECADGATPYAALIQYTNGALYGTTSYGGAYDTCVLVGNYTGCGNLFSVSVSLKAFIEANPTWGKVGTAVKLLGNNLEHATSVSFKGTSATIEKSSRTELSTTVPAGATTGIVQVVTPGGTLSSNVPFPVLP